jgi:HPt (histidine-containing phosphotransfer) domain-containing protein
LSRVIVHADPDLSDLIPGFLSRKRVDLGAIVRATDAADYGALAAIGHKIKGEGGSYGFDAITEIGAAIEAAANARDLPALRRCAQEFEQFLDSVEIIYD